MLELDSDPYSMFVFAMNAKQTKEKYTARLKRFFDFIELPGNNIEEKCKLAVKMERDKERSQDSGNNNNNNNKWFLNNVLRFLQAEKERVERKEITGATLRNYVKAIKLFCEMNDILIPWKKITRGLPRGRKTADDRAPTIDEIRRIVEYPDRRIKSIVCTMCSSGIRLGAWDYLRWKDIQPARDIVHNEEKILAAKIIVYAGDEEEYFSFITPEAYHELEKWMNYRRESGESINGNSWVLRNIWDTKQGFKRGFIDSPRKLKSSGVKRLMEDALWIQGLRKNLQQGRRRHEFQADHGFRKWFKTRCEISGMKPINIEKLMGHSIGIPGSYYRATERELLDDYVKAIDFLTISNENRLKKQIQDVVEQSKVNNDNIKSQIYDKEQAINNLTERNSSNTDAIAALSDQVLKLTKEIEMLKKT
jgi:integrase